MPRGRRDPLFPVVDDDVVVGTGEVERMGIVRSWCRILIGIAPWIDRNHFLFHEGAALGFVEQSFKAMEAYQKMFMDALEQSAGNKKKK